MCYYADLTSSFRSGPVVFQMDESERAGQKRLVQSIQSLEKARDWNPRMALQIVSEHV